MSDETVIAAAVGLTEKQKGALEAITRFVGRHGVMPSRRQLAGELGCTVDNAAQLITRLTERGQLCTFTPGGMLSGFGRDGVAVFVPAHVAAALATYCAAEGERITAVVADAIMLHFDQLAPPVPVSDECGEVAGEYQRCMDMLGDVPGATLEQRLARYVGSFMALQAAAISASDAGVAE